MWQKQGRGEEKQKHSSSQTFAVSKCLKHYITHSVHILN